VAKILGKVAVAAALATALAASGPVFATLITDTAPGSAVTSESNVASTAATTAASAFSLLSGHEAFSAGGIASNFSAQSRVPEPTTLALLGLGVAGLGFIRRRRK
jgi:PEP-CTERM motif